MGGKVLGRFRKKYYISIVMAFLLGILAMFFTVVTVYNIIILRPSRLLLGVPFMIGFWYLVNLQCDDIVKYSKESE